MQATSPPTPLRSAMQPSDPDPDRRPISADEGTSAPASVTAPAPQALKLPSVIVGLILVLGVAVGALSVIAAVGFGLLGGRSMGLGTAEMPLTEHGGPGGGQDGTGGPPSGPMASPVEVVPAVEIVAAERVELLGTAAPIRESLVASEVDGLLSELRVHEGDSVRTGQVLVRLRTAAIEQQLAAARAARDETDARLSRASADFDRLASLLQRAAISQREYEQAVADRDAFAQGVARLGAEVARLEDVLARATVRAPFAGRVAAVHVEIGEWVAQGTQIISLIDLSEVEVAVQIAERYISAIEPGFRVDVRLDALPGLDYVGTVRAIVPQAVPEARTFPVLIRVPNPGLAIKGGMAARVAAQLGSPEPAMLVSKDAIVRRGDQVLVFRVMATGPPTASGVGTRGMIEQVSVDIGPARGQWQVVYGAVAGGDLVVVRGNERVFPGQPVQVSAVRELTVPMADLSKPIAVDPRQETGS